MTCPKFGACVAHYGHWKFASACYTTQVFRRRAKLLLATARIWAGALAFTLPPSTCTSRAPCRSSNVTLTRTVVLRGRGRGSACGRSVREVAVDARPAFSPGDSAEFKYKSQHPCAKHRDKHSHKASTGRSDVGVRAFRLTFDGGPSAGRDQESRNTRDNCDEQQG